MLAAGTTLGPYKILAPLDAGGMDEVHRAQDSRLGHDVANKGLLPGAAGAAGAAGAPDGRTSIHASHGLAPGQVG